MIGDMVHMAYMVRFGPTAPNNHHYPQITPPHTSSAQTNHANHVNHVESAQAGQPTQAPQYGHPRLGPISKAELESARSDLADRPWRATP